MYRRAVPLSALATNARLATLTLELILKREERSVVRR